MNERNEVTLVLDGTLVPRYHVSRGEMVAFLTREWATLLQCLRTSDKLKLKNMRQGIEYRLQYDHTEVGAFDQPWGHWLELPSLLPIQHCWNPAQEQAPPPVEPPKLQPQRLLRVLVSIGIGKPWQAPLHSVLLFPNQHNPHLQK